MTKLGYVPHALSLTQTGKQLAGTEQGLVFPWRPLGPLAASRPLILPRPSFPSPLPKLLLIQNTFSVVPG